MSELRTNRIVPRDGLPSGSSGGIIQVKSTTITDKIAITTTDTFTDITGLSVSITPTRSDSKILIFYDTQMSGTEIMFIRLMRGSTPIKIGDDGGGNRIQVTQGGFKQEENQDKLVPFGGTFLDSPATTSTTTYKLQARVYGTSQYFKVNAPNNDSNASYTGRGASTITVMEVSG
tara:strand:- start:21 stop:545 length:525 start_codon:yes stop_codon:yes gene_type:complete